MVLDPFQLLEKSYFPRVRLRNFAQAKVADARMLLVGA
jgi:hypothetical protein